MKKGNASGGFKIAQLLLAGMTWLAVAAAPAGFANPARVEVIVEPAATGHADWSAVEARVKKRFPALGLMLVEVPARNLSGLKRLPGVRQVVLDREVRADAVLPLDRGGEADDASAGLAAAVLDARNGETRPCRPAGRVVVAAGRLTQTGPGDGRAEACVEVVPGAPTWELQALDANGRGRLSDLLTALEWVAESVDRHRIRVLAMPFREALSLPEEEDPLVTATARLWERGVAVVVPDRVSAQREAPRLTSMR